MIDCDKIRERLEADPARLDTETAGHLEQCTACSAYAERVRATERLIHDAFRFDVGALKKSAAAVPERSSWFGLPRTAWSGAAALLVAGFALWFGFSAPPAADHGQLVAEVLNHWYEEPNSWVRTDVRVSPASLEDVISGQASIDVANLGLLSYAQSCFVGGEWVPHLVLQGENGPVMLLLLPRQSVTGPVPLELPEEGLSGVLVPLGEGSVAIMGEQEEPLQLIRDRLDAAVEWAI